MRVTVRFWSYFRDLAGCAEAEVEIPEGGLVGDVLDEVGRRFPKLAPARACTLAALGVEYANAASPVPAGDIVSLFPPVQGG